MGAVVGRRWVSVGHHSPSTRYRYDAPTADRPWAQIIGGGPDMGFSGSGDNRKEDPGKFPTVVEGLIYRGRLEIRVHNLVTGTIQDRFTFPPRR